MMVVPEMYPNSVLMPAHQGVLKLPYQTTSLVQQANQKEKPSLSFIVSSLESCTLLNQTQPTESFGLSVSSLSSFCHDWNG